MAASHRERQLTRAAAPSSFFIPPAAIRDGLQVGDTVKLIFRLTPDQAEPVVERMWVEVTSARPYVGTLLNTPRTAGVIEPGTAVRFGPEHVCAFAYDDASLGYPVDARCFVLRRIVADGAPPALLFRNHDGEWEAHADHETDEEVADAGNVTTVQLGWLTDRFPATTPALVEGSAGDLRGIWWRWDGGAYVRVAT